MINRDFSFRIATDSSCLPCIDQSRHLRFSSCHGSPLRCPIVRAHRPCRSETCIDLPFAKSSFFAKHSRSFVDGREEFDRIRRQGPCKARSIHCSGRLASPSASCQSHKGGQASSRSIRGKPQASRMTCANMSIDTKDVLVHASWANEKLNCCFARPAHVASDANAKENWRGMLFAVAVIKRHL